MSANQHLRRGGLLALAPMTLAALGSGLPHCAAAADNSSGRSIADLSIEELLNIEVVSANRKPQHLTDTAAAASVITQDDIHRSGAGNVPELLRMVPGVDVAWISGDAYSVTIRGFAGRFANKLLVLRDGRSLYNSLFAGVFWERELPLLEDIERIEIIRGPGAAVWGANAVNGVINIITKSARDTPGVLAGASAGGDSYRDGYARLGTNLSDDTSLKLYARGAEGRPGRDSGTDPAGLTTDGQVRNTLAGLRLDRVANGSTLTLQADAHNARDALPIEEPLPYLPYTTIASSQQRMNGANLQARYEMGLGSGRSVDMQANYSHDQVQFDGMVDERRDVLSLQGQAHFLVHANHDVMLGATLQSDADQFQTSQFVNIDPLSRNRWTSSLLAQDEIALHDGRAHLTLGTILEHDSLAGMHAMPEARLAFNLTSSDTLWLAASRAVRSPSRAERDMQVLLGPVIPAQPPYVPLAVVPTIEGSADFGLEKEISYQAGYRGQIAHDVSIDVAAYTSHYTDLRLGIADTTALTPAVFNGIPYLQLPVTITNAMNADASGLELSVDWRARDWWRLTASASRIWISTNMEGAEDTPTNTPKFNATLRSMMDLGALRLDLAARHVGSRQLTQNIPAYTALDARLAWTPVRNVEWSVRGTNLTSAHHLEFVADNLVSPPREADRTFYTAVQVSF